MIPWLRRPNNNHRDTLFNLPLYPPAPKKNGGVDLASQQLTTDVNKLLKSVYVFKARPQL